MNQKGSTNTPEIDILDIAEDPMMFLAVSMSLLGSVLKGKSGYPSNMLAGESKIARNHIGQN